MSPRVFHRVEIILVRKLVLTVTAPSAKTAELFALFHRESHGEQDFEKQPEAILHVQSTKVEAQS